MVEKNFRSSRSMKSGASVLLLLVLFLLTACGSKRPVEVRTDPPPPPPAETGSEAADAEPAPPPDAGAGTPRRQASEHLTAQGVERLEAGELDAAARRLEEAIRVDGSNGDAYYHLARVRVAAGRNDEARELLDRAIELLRPYPERRAEAERLRSRL